jgi:hypothetical protein
MTFGRRRRPDDWATSHARARAALSDRLDGVLEPSEAGWLDDHLTGCADCRAAEADYDAQRIALRAAAAATPVTPRDLWARTAAAIERESSFRDRRSTAPGGRRRSLLRSPLIATALVVVVAVGTLISSRLRVGDGPTAPPSAASAATASDTIVASVLPGATPIVVGEHVQWISRDTEGRYRLTNWDVTAVCPDGSGGCTSAAPVQDQPVEITTEPQTVFGTPDGKQLIVVNDSNQTHAASVSVVAVPSSAPPVASPPPSVAASVVPSSPATQSPSVTPSGTPTGQPTPTPRSTPSATASTGGTATPTAAATATPTATASAGASTSPSVSITPSHSPGEAVQIAENVVLVGQSAAYSPDFEWFAFTARPSDGSTGPDVYLWKVGDAEAHAVTTDHHSTFGSWTTDNLAVGSSIANVATSGSQPPDDLSGVSFVLDPGTGRRVALPQTGRTWRPAVDPTGRRAVYWAGSLRQRSDAPVFVPSAGRLVVGDWNVEASAPSGGPVATPLSGDQANARHETTIEAGRIDDWDARWDSTGTKLAVWIADAGRLDVGRLSLYAVDPFDGRVDLKKPLLDATRASAGFSMSEGKLVWAEPAADGSSSGGQVLVLAWNGQGTGTVQTLSGEVVVIR